MTSHIVSFEILSYKKPAKSAVLMVVVVLIPAIDYNIDPPCRAHYESLCTLLTDSSHATSGNY